MAEKEEKVKCPGCGSLVEADLTVCPYCGHTLQKKNTFVQPVRIHTSSRVKVIEESNTEQLPLMEPDDLEKTEVRLETEETEETEVPEEKDEIPAEPPHHSGRPVWLLPVVLAAAAVAVIAVSLNMGHHDETAASVTPLPTASAETAAAAEPTEETADGYILPESSERELTDEDVAGLTLQQLNYARNEIFARHGYIFSSPELNSYFTSQSWYEGTIPQSEFDFNLLSSIEVKNVEFLLAKEKAIDPNGYQLDQ
jgi:hypothetical protein